MGRAVMSAARLFALGFRLVGDWVGRRRELGLELAEGRAGGILLPECRKRHAEPEQAVRRLLAGLVFLVALEEGVGRVLVIAAHEIGLADPVLRAARERVRRIASDQVAEDGLGSCI